MAAWRQIRIHLVWGTWDRLPLLDEQHERLAFATISAQANRLRCELHALGGADDHVHLLVSLHSSVALATFVRAVKSASTVAIGKSLAGSTPFRWQHGYAAISVWPHQGEVVRNYVLNQRKHHADRTIDPMLDPPLEDLDVDD